MRHVYTPEEDAFITANVKGISVKELRDRFNTEFNLDVSVSSIENRKARLGLKSGYRYYFEKGHVPFNKGLKLDDYLTKEQQQKMAQTQFKRGRRNNRFVPIGTETKDKDGYVYVKVNDTMYAKKNWVPKQKYIYEKYIGKVPKGYIVMFADRDIYNYDLDNLILVSRSERMIMNTKHLIYNDKELTKTGHLVAQVIDKTNKMKRNG